jgi:UPF0755 protein
MSLARIFRYGLVLLALAAVVAGAFAWSVLTRPLPLPQSPFEFEVRTGAALGAVARELEEAGALPRAWTLRLLARWRGQDRTIKAGSYEIESGITLPQLLATLTEGDVTQSAFVIVEGATFAEVRKAMRASPALRNTVLDLADAELMARLGAAGTSPEGAFHPDTYYFAPGNADVAVLKRALRAHEVRLADAWARRAPEVPLKSPAEALVLASIVEKETGRAADRPLIASVFTNRLRRGMRLQTDPTVIYGMGERFDGNLRKRDLEADTPWNTYTRDGLPPTPIAMASQASLDAVVNPPATEFLYFVARGDGSSHFSTNLADHNRAVSKFQKGGR